MRALALIKRPPPPLVAQVLSSSRRPRSTFAPMLVHLGALGRHLGANMSQHTPKMRSKMRSWSQHGSKQCPRRFNKPLQPPRITKNHKKTLFLMIFAIRPMCENAPKSKPNQAKIDPKSAKLTTKSLS